VEDLRGGVVAINTRVRARKKNPEKGTAVNITTSRARFYKNPAASRSTRRILLRDSRAIKKKKREKKIHSQRRAKKRRRECSERSLKYLVLHPRRFENQPLFKLFPTFLRELIFFL